VVIRMKRFRDRILPGVLFCVSAALAFGGCERGDPQAAAAPSPAAAEGISLRFPGRDPMLRWDAAGNLHVLYVEEREGGGGVAYRRLGREPAGRGVHLPR
jgi:hypothetical protein